MGCCASNEPRATGSTPSHGNPASTSALNTELNNVARNTDDTAKARALVARGADLASTNGPHWRHTPLHQAAYHGRYEMAKTLVELGAPLHLHLLPSLSWWQILAPTTGVSNGADDCLDC